MAKTGDWVRIHRNILETGERAEGLPADTTATPLQMWVKGHLLCDGEMGGEVTVRTRVGRVEHGRLIEVNPQYELNYGDFVPEILQIDDALRGALYGGAE